MTAEVAPSSAGRVEAGEAEPVEAYFAARRRASAPGADGFPGAEPPAC